MSMQQLVTIINDNQKSSINFLDYLQIIDIIKEKRVAAPDVSIESCKSLIEGICKKILFHIDKSENEVTLNKEDFTPLFKKTIKAVSNYDKKFEEEFSRRCAALIGIIGEIRNERGEISHGKIYPKEIESTIIFADFVISLTEMLMIYIIKSFYSLDLDIYEVEKYEDNFTFNDYLDSLYPEVPISYSRALYDQDYIQYEQLLLDYNNAEQENINDK